MKKSFLVCCLVLITAAGLQAQEKENKPAGYKKSFTVKFVPAGLAVGKITFGAEYNFKRKQSITLLLGVPFDKSHNINYENKQSDITSNARSAMLGYRYYLGKKGRSGFYAEPYLKYLNLKASGFVDGDLNGRAARFDTHISYEGYGGGIQLGFQFYIAKLVSIDMFLLGPEANAAKFSSVATDIYDNIPWSLADGQQAASDLHDKVKDIPYLGDKIEISVNTSSKTVFTKYSGFLPGLRAGLSVGVRF